MAANFIKYPPIAVTKGIGPQATLWEWATDDNSEDIVAPNYLVTGGKGLDMTVGAISRKIRPGDYITVQTLSSGSEPTRNGRYYVLYTPDPETYTLIPCTMGLRDTNPYLYRFYQSGRLTWSGGLNTLVFIASSVWVYGFELLVSFQTRAGSVTKVSATYIEGTQGHYLISLDTADISNTTIINYALIGKGYSA